MRSAVHQNEHMKLLVNIKLQYNKSKTETLDHSDITEEDTKDHPHQEQTDLVLKPKPLFRGQGQQSKSPKTDSSNEINRTSK